MHHDFLRAETAPLLGLAIIQNSTLQILNLLRLFVLQLIQSNQQIIQNLTKEKQEMNNTMMSIQSQLIEMSIKADTLEKENKILKTIFQLIDSMTLNKIHHHQNLVYLPIFELNQVVVHIESLIYQ